jgi:hypothetical protein
MADDSPRVLRVPRCINPIMDVRDQMLPEDPSPPFFGFAPAETPVRIVHCRECDSPVSAAHLALHRRNHEPANKPEPVKPHETFQIRSDSALEPLTPCAYARRYAYPFQTLFEPENRK